MSTDTSLPIRTVTDPDIKATYAVDQSVGATAPSQFEVVRARDLEDVVEVLRWAHETRTPVVPQGARSSLTGSSVAIEAGVVLNTEGLDAISTVDPLEALAVVGPGVITKDLKDAAAAAGLFYPPDPASSAFCTIGGNVATNAGGLCCVKYGVTADYVRALQVVLPGGEVIRTGHRTAKGVAGLDLTGLFVGSEGTLGVITEVTTRLVPAPDPALTVLATFGSLEAAGRAIVALRLERHLPSLVELLDRAAVAAVQSLADYGFPQDCEAVLLVQSDRPGHTADDVQRYAAVLAEAGAVDVAVADDAAEADLLLAGRRALSPALEAKGPRYLEDVCVPVGRLTELIRSGQEVAARHGLEIVMAGHAGDGNLHPSIFFDADDASSRARAHQAFTEIITAALRLGGTITGEHGIGTLKAPWLAEELGERELERQRAVKALFDPRGILNPGRVYWS
ncbi:glycolate oxidase [Phycicoccus badiiscoriae]|uniref:Glycolate oxidase n=1 Tax=Pedococcus badiiscoriae TaxID=642776 RepID=A0A852WP76_9MICO|nr:FAD-linked oxidase C-terminal domain-containing protein [Pedococcus badiiscoriae]NYG08035.1 glycolate oxidase [Pedococcus badiiscoriae]